MQTALIIFVLTYIIIGIQNIPRIHITRPAGALLGAVAMVFFGVITLKEAYSAIDFDVILFVLGMMIIVAYMEISGFFEIVEDFILKRAKSSSALLLLVVLSSGIFSSLFMNDTICLMFTPIVLRVTSRAGLNPIPYLIALATASNVGSTMTIIGNPQNMLIGIYSGIPFLEFSRILAPVSVLGLAFNFFIIRYIYRKEITGHPITISKREEILRPHKELLAVSMVATVLLLVFLSLGYRPPAVAIALACFLIIAGAAKPREALEKVDWTLLLFFSGLFVVMKGIETVGITGHIFSHAQTFITGGKLGQIVNVSAASAAVSNLISNVPAVMLFSEVIKRAMDSKLIWLTLAMSSTLAGNLTIIASVANIIVFEGAKGKVKISFFEYLKVGLPVTIVTTIVGIAVLYFTL